MKYDAPGAFGEVRFFATSMPMDRFKCLERSVCVGWHKVNELYRIHRSKGAGMGLLLFTVGGQGVVYVDGKKIHAEAGSVVVIPKGIPHAYGVNKGKQWEFYWIHYAGSFSDTCAEDVTQNGNYSFDVGVNEIRFLMSPLIDQNVKTAVSRFEETETLQRIFMVLLHKSLENKNYVKVDDMIEFMEKEDVDGFSLDALSKEFHYSKEYIIRLFKKATGVSPYRYFMMMILKRSCRDLEENVLTVSEIADKYGYSTVSGYTKQFKRIFQVSPSEYRGLFFGN